MRRALAMAFLLLTLQACAQLRPLEEIRSTLPPERFVEVAGKQLYVEQSGERETVLLIHGIRASSLEWRTIAPGLARSHRVIVPDLYGHGWSPRGPDLDAYGIEGQSELLVALMDRLEIRKAHVVGHSMGAAIALWMAVRHPDRVRSLVLVSGPPPASVNVWLRVLRVLRPLAYAYVRTVGLSSWGYRLNQRFAVYDGSSLTEEMIEGGRQRLCVEGMGTTLEGFATRLRFPDPVPLIRKAKAPVLLVWGEDDIGIPARVGRELAQACPGAQFLLVPRCRHLVAEEHPAVLLDALQGFLASQE